MSETVSIPTLSGNADFSAYLAKPAGKPKAAILVIQEIFGVNAGIRRKCDKWAEEGYLAVAPDLFFRMEPNLELDPDIEPEFNKALELFGKYDAEDGVRDIEATIKWIRKEAGVEKVGCVGYCLGGKLAYMTATRTDVDASVGYYGVMIDQMIGEAKAIANPLMLHIPTEDHFVDKAAQKAMHDGLDAHDKVTLHDYAGLDHGFATEHGKRRDEEGAQLADRRTWEFFAQNLG
ncbi:dienelactone hydrolase family protein [Altererythrobacter luteolus]|uniref:Dienelactone hydrolase family protein n=1 Tax=Pontixanthobacter luteolus TaxID=295089 RepID=A0A6I4V0U0_9SPHN|nr:dienelactone hydrolase family protein [Pontixanthobacter luteolus]MXP47889.1 dienelactone hydrolase family protein [Pontixanthobacter luteolus]